MTEALWSRELGLRSNFSDFEHDFDPFKLCFDSINTHEMAIYNHERLKLDDSPFMKQNADFQEGILQA